RAHLSPDAGVAGVRPRILFPGIVAEFARPWNRVENPETLPGLRVVTANVALLVRLAARRSARQVRRADDDDVADDEPRRVQAKFAGHEIHVLIVFGLQIDDAVFAEGVNELTGLGVERDHLVARRHIKDPFFATVGPIRQAAPRELARR